MVNISFFNPVSWTCREFGVKKNEITRIWIDSCILAVRKHSLLLYWPTYLSPPSTGCPHYSATTLNDVISQNTRILVNNKLSFAYLHKWLQAGMNLIFSFFFHKKSKLRRKRDYMKYWQYFRKLQFVSWIL
jgi:hypothetical protein